MRPEVVIVLFSNRVYLYKMPQFQIIGQIDTVQHSTVLIGLSHLEENFVMAVPHQEEGKIMLKTTLEQG